MVERKCPWCGNYYLGTWSTGCCGCGFKFGRAIISKIWGYLHD
ncbi:MAG: hypothetical protein WC460_06210 [Patescibacteria group bacterium]